MKHTLKNPANPFAMLLMALAMALAFLACEEKDKKAEAGGGEVPADCPEKTGPLQTAEATFLELAGGIDDLEAFIFRLADGKEMTLYSYDNLVKNMVNNLKKGDKVSITYKKKQNYSQTDEKSCWNYDALESVEAGCPKTTGPLQTAEAMFLEIDVGPANFEVAIFNLADGNKINLFSDKEQIKNIVKNMKKGNKAAITYKETQELDGKFCWKYKALESVKILSNDELATPENCPNITGPLQTAEATLLKADSGPEIATFRLADGNVIALLANSLFIDYGDPPKLKHGLKKGDKVSITYQINQVALEVCTNESVLISVKKLPK
jgi:predicted secreted protein